MPKQLSFRCPICKKPVERDNDSFPFCSERCRQIDLGNWADGSYAIPGDPAATDILDKDPDQSIH